MISERVLRERLERYSTTRDRETLIRCVVWAAGRRNLSPEEAHAVMLKIFPDWPGQEDKRRIPKNDPFFGFLDRMPDYQLHALMYVLGTPQPLADYQGGLETLKELL